MEFIQVGVLRDHPGNRLYFDDMTGDKWEEFLQSVRTSGIIEPIVITQDNIIVSGHQRVRACKQLGITEILAERKTYADEKQVVKDLIETNVRQRGSVGGSYRQIAARVDALNAYYGCAQHKKVYGTLLSGTEPITKADVAERAGTTEDAYKTAKKLLSTIPEVQSLLDEGKISAKSVRNLIAKLTPEEQLAVVQGLPVADRITETEVKHTIELMRENENLQSRVKEVEQTLERTKQQLNTAQAASRTSYINYALRGGERVTSERDVQDIMLRVQSTVGGYLSEMQELAKQSSVMLDLPADIAQILLKTARDALKQTELLCSTLQCSIDCKSECKAKVKVSDNGESVGGE